MCAKPVVTSNIQNRSPWIVGVRSKPDCCKKFSYPNVQAAQAYCASLQVRGQKAKVTQLETSFQLRVRRKGVNDQIVTFDTRQQADQARLQIEANLAVCIVRDYAIAAKTDLRALMQRYLEEVVPSHKGRSVESLRLRHLMRDESFVDKKLAALSTEDFQDFITDRLTEVAPSTVDRELDLISQVLRYADDVWKIAPAESPFKGLRRPQYFNERDRRLEPEEEHALLAAARNDENPYLEPAIILAIETAMRRGELLSVATKDINFERRYVHLKDTKNGRSRKVPLSTRAMEVLIALQERSASDDAPLLNLTANALKIGFFRRVIPAAKVLDFHFHDLRHEAVSRLAESGKFSLIELQAISGHRDMRMLQRYAHLCSGNLADKMDEVSAERKVYVHRGRKRTLNVAQTSVILEQGNKIDAELSPLPLKENSEWPDNVIDFRRIKRA